MKHVSVALKISQKEDNMEAKRINKEITITAAERQEIAQKLIDAGIDRRKVEAALLQSQASAAGGNVCCHKDQCHNYFKMDPNAMRALTDEIKRKGINTQALGGAAAKYLK